jgi:cytochrome c oxidase subunit 2
VNPAGPQAAHIAWLWDVMLWVSITVAVLVIVFEVAAIALGARRPHDTADPLASDRAQDRRLIRAIEVAGGLTVLTLIALLVASVRTGNALAGLSEQGALHVRLTGHQWWWQVEYDEPKPELRVTDANELHIPVGRNVRLELASADVIHSFWVPDLSGKQDLIPGRLNVIDLRADRPGVYRGQCAEFCGVEHAEMALTVYAEPPEQFAAWLAAASRPAPPPTDALALRGRDLFVHRTCAMCHAVAGTDAGATTGPDLSHVASRGTLAAGTLPNVVGARAGWILDPQRVKPGVLMPATPLSSDDLDALLAYLETLR